MRVVVWHFAGEMRTWGSLALCIFPAHRELRRVRAELAQVRRFAILRAVEPVAPPSVDLIPLVSAVQDTVTALQEIAPQVTQASSENPVRLRAVT